jgi:hypothetical protein
VRQVGYLPELYEDARSEKYKILYMRCTYVLCITVKIRPVEAELFHADGRKEMTKFNSRFSQFCENRLKTKQ